MEKASFLVSHEKPFALPRNSPACRGVRHPESRTSLDPGENSWAKYLVSRQETLPSLYTPLPSPFPLFLLLADNT